MHCFVLLESTGQIAYIPEALVEPSGRRTFFPVTRCVCSTQSPHAQIPEIFVYIFVFVFIAAANSHIGIKARSYLIELFDETDADTDLCRGGCSGGHRTDYQYSHG